jgi:isopentenyldiphosphate isomerase
MQDELLDIVNEHDRIVGSAMRSAVHQRGLRHRGVHVFLFASDTTLLVQQRSPEADASPSLLDCSVSEHVRTGETYLQAAVRGLKEELGLDPVELSPLVRFAMAYGPNDNKIGQLYQGAVDPNQVHYNPGEVSGIAYHEMTGLLAMARTGDARLSRWFRQFLCWFGGLPSEIHVLEEG